MYNLQPLIINYLLISNYHLIKQLDYLTSSVLFNIHLHSKNPVMGICVKTNK